MGRLRFQKNHTIKLFDYAYSTISRVIAQVSHACRGSCQGETFLRTRRQLLREYLIVLSEISLLITAASTCYDSAARCTCASRDAYASSTHHSLILLATKMQGRLQGRCEREDPRTEWDKDREVEKKKKEEEKKGGGRERSDHEKQDRAESA